MEGVILLTKDKGKKEGGKCISCFGFFLEYEGMHNFLKWIYLKEKDRALYSANYVGIFLWYTA